MKQYPKILHHNSGLIGHTCYGFDKIDGSSVRFEWSKKRGWYKFGSRMVMIDRNTPILGNSIDLFLNKYGEDLDRIFRSKYKSVESFVVFGEYFGEKSFAGQHVEEDEKDVILFDVSQYKRGFIPPHEFIDNFGQLHIPKLIHKGVYDENLIKSVRENTLNLEEGIVCKGVMKTKREGQIIWMSKIKTNEWLNKVKLLYGEKALLDEFNNDKKLMQLCTI